MNAWLTALLLAQAVGGGRPPAAPPAPPPSAVQPAAPAAPVPAGEPAAVPAPAPAPAPVVAPGVTGAPAIQQGQGGVATTAAPDLSRRETQVPDAGGGMWQTLAFFGVMILVFWLLIIRPQSKQRKKQEEFLKALAPGDRVLTASGLIGRIVSIEGDIVTLEIAKDVRVRMVKGHVASQFKEGDTTKAS